jgi:transposase
VFSFGNLNKFLVMDDSPVISDTNGCPECADLRKRIEELEAIVRELRQRLNQNSSNSSIPPSANPLHAPRRLPKKPSGRKPGGQPGHRGHYRQLVPSERVDEVITYVPEKCAGCQADLPPEASPDDPRPRRHQVAELPPLAVVITEHQAMSRTCPCCGEVNRAEIPPHVLSHTIGPRLAAVMSCFSGVYRLSRRSIEEIVETIFGVPASLGSIVALEMQTSSALADAYQRIQAEVRSSPVKNIDETGWRERGIRNWLWTAATSTSALFLIHAKRGFAGLQALLGETIEGIVSSDRWSAYARLNPENRQICWAHLKRDFQKLVDRGGPSEAVGRSGLEVTQCLFADWWEFREGMIDRKRLASRLNRIRAEFLAELELGCRSPDKKTARFCRNLLSIDRALWSFGEVEGVEPTNNHAERILRPAVLWRKCSFGNQSRSGREFTQRILTVVQTAKLRQQQPLDLLCESILSYRLSRSAPQMPSQT